MERLEKAKADLQADMDQQLSSLHDAVTQKESAILSVRRCIAYVYMSVSTYLLIVS